MSRQIRTAVQRNRARRRLREAYRRAREAAPPALDAILIAKRRVLIETFETLTTELREALRSIPGTRSDT